MTPQEKLVIDYIQKYGSMPDEVDAVEMVLWMWQKEQEGYNETR